MKPARVVPAETVALQARAADPGNSVWVSANAGSGKTHVLSQRVIRLLLQGAEPSRILCLTYTRAAAANMSNRVFQILSEWTALDDGALARALEAVEGGRPGPQRLARARRLFAEALETPGGLKIQTIHAFCEAILQQFPLEANIAGHFELLDGPMEAALFAEARRAMIEGAADAADPALAEAFAVVLQRAGESGLDELLGAIVARRDALRGFIAEIGDGGGGFEPLFEEFGFQAGESEGSLAAAAWPLPGFTPTYFAGFAEAARQAGAATVLSKIVPDAAKAFAETDPLARLELLAAGFLTDKGAPYAHRTFTKALCARLPDLPERYDGAAAAIVAARDRLALFRMVRATAAALTLADWLIGRYERLKRARGFLDFNDLIVRTANLLSRRDAGAWVHYKLDQGIDHILIDEAQDTSPRQWEVVRKLAEEFFAGYGARDGRARTIFAVGDEKQSIYSFQGADPESFAETGALFAGKVAAARAAFEHARLTWSFRSTADVLEAVDRVFRRPEIRTGLTRYGDPIEHKAIREGEPGYVELWPAIGAAAVEEPDDWTLAIDHASAPSVQVAERVATTVQHWIAFGERLEGRGRRVGAGDVLVLVRKRDRFVHALSRSLKRRGIEVAGADRLNLAGHLAVKDLVALGRFVLQPEDDLSLAALLRSPAFGFSEDELFDLAWNRGGASLHAALRRRAPSSPRLAAVAAALDDWADQAAYRPPFEFYAGVLAGRPGEPGLRAKIVGRLGRDACDMLDEFLAFCMAQERAGLPGLETLLATLEGAAPEIKREMDQRRDEVRIMTVHAAKGLEAPIVFLVDGGAAPFSAQHLPRLIPVASRSRLWRGDGFLWRCGSDVANGEAAAVEAVIRRKAEEEYRRLLYVGMTRAEDRLIVCGYHGKRQPGPDTWHRIVEAALAGEPETSERFDPVLDANVLRFRVTPPARPSQAGPAAEAAAEPVPEAAGAPVLPPRFAPLPPPPALPRPLAPSRATALVEEGPGEPPAGRSPVFAVAGAPSLAIRRGVVIHRLLQALPEADEIDRPRLADAHLARVGADWPDAARAQARDSVLAILADPRFAALFSGRSRAEVSLMGTVGIGGVPRAVAGTIDRLVVQEDEVLVADYKTTAPPPAALSEVPQAHVAQLALYRALLADIYPGRRIVAALLYTEAPLLIPVPEAAMDEALLRLKGRGRAA